jgi:hypothetical protein
MNELLQHTLAPLRNPRLWAVHIPANALLLTAALFWTRIPDEKLWQLAATTLSALLILLLFLWLHSATLRISAGVAQTVRPRTLAMIWLLLGLAAITAVILEFGTLRENYEATVSGYLFFRLPHFIQNHCDASTIDTWLQRLDDLLQLFVLPALLLPSLAAGVVGGRTARALKSLISWRYWLMIAIAGIVGIWLPRLILLHWVPGKHLCAMTVSLVLRLTLAYLLTLMAWLAATGVLGYFTAGSASPETRP